MTEAEAKLLPRTPWYRIRDDKPSRLGWYETALAAFDDSIDNSTIARRYWDGESWSYCVFVGDSDSTAERAKQARHRAPGALGHMFWRGLTEQRHS